MDQSVAMTAGGAGRGMRTPGPVSRSIYAAAEMLIVAGVIVQLFVFTKRLMTPIDVSGALFGGAMGAFADVMMGAALLGGVLMAALLRLPGSRLAWIAAGALPIVLGTLALWSYPDDYGGKLIFSPQRPEIISLMVFGGAFLLLGEMLRRYMVMPTLSGGKKALLWIAFRVLAMVAMAVLFIAIPIALQIEKRQPLPPCSHDSTGQQLTLCL